VIFIYDKLDYISMNDTDYTIFEGKTFQDLTKDIYENSRTKKLLWK